MFASSSIKATASEEERFEREAQHEDLIFAESAFICYNHKQDERK